MILMESVYNSRNKDLDYLAEYLIQKPKLTLTEAKELLQVIKEEETMLLEKARNIAEGRIEDIKAISDEQIAAIKQQIADAGGYAGVKKSELTRLQRQMEKIRNWRKSAIEKAKSVYKTTVDFIKNKATGEKGSVKSAYKRASGFIGKAGTKTKVGAGLAAGGLATAAGLAAYNAKKKRKEALAKSKKK